MNAYTIHHLFECKITGAVLTEVSFSLNDELKCHVRPFSNMTNAKTILEQEKREWILGAVEKYVNHKKHIIDANGTESQRKSLQLCYQGLDHYQKVSTQKIAASILKGINHFIAILPVGTNPSYESSCQNLEEIKKFCNAELQQPQPNTTNK